MSLGWRAFHRWDTGGGWPIVTDSAVIQAEVIIYLLMISFQNWWSLFHCRDLMLEKSIPLVMPSEILKTSGP